ncbi:methyltransferase domain-containing protein [Marinilactibacillus psychrotolerans]|uniref:Methyltransferase domain-containing protein n=1 Tax=Marinilactibacillus psychrotolerans TaxID=191770 RepID=A0A5R9C7R1_9LACT|nr:methyltransferase domain-containing protein [Marinilactibacillus psychrotolerans]TLQ09317.1 methyltransferase domain-containing protein [Marinilactibacillus psychrotolerans]
MKKIENSKLFINNHLDLFQCPICKDHFIPIQDSQLVCSNHHSFDLSKKGTVHFLLKQPQNEYNKDMLQSRRLIAEDGLWYPMLKNIVSEVNYKNGVHLDVGCGEGSHLQHLIKLGLEGTNIGFDISKDAIQLASAAYTDAFWCVADLAHSPFASNSYDTIFNILSPSNYKEFDRLLKSGGQVIKVVPSEKYLIEIRELIGKNNTPYSNKDVLNKFYQHYPNANRITVSYDHNLNSEMWEHLLNMTPLGWNIEESNREQLILAPSEKITIEMEILIGTKD